MIYLYAMRYLIIVFRFPPTRPVLKGEARGRGRFTPGVSAPQPTLMVSYLVPYFNLWSQYYSAVPYTTSKRTLARVTGLPPLPRPCKMAKVYTFQWLMKAFQVGIFIYLFYSYAPFKFHSESIGLWSWPRLRRYF